jgi:hypothetical protein
VFLISGLRQVSQHLATPERDTNRLTTAPSSS